MAHLALAVHNEERSRRFYERYFGFDAVPAERMDDGVLMLFDAAGYALALKETDEPIVLPSFFHFAFAGAASPEHASPSPSSGTSPTTSASSAATRTATSSSWPGSPTDGGRVSAEPARRPNGWNRSRYPPSR